MSEQGGARRPIASRAPNRGERGRQGNQQVWYIQLRNLVLTVLALAAGWWITEAVFSFLRRYSRTFRSSISIPGKFLLFANQRDDQLRVTASLKPTG